MRQGTDSRENWTQLQFVQRWLGVLKEEGGNRKGVSWSSVEWGKWKITKSRRENWSIWNPPGFANWHSLKLGSYPPTETERQGSFRCWLEQILLAALSFSGRPSKNTLSVILSMWPWAVRDLEFCSSIYRAKLIDLVEKKV